LPSTRSLKLEAIPRFVQYSGSTSLSVSSLPIAKSAIQGIRRRFNRRDQSEVDRFIIDRIDSVPHLEDLARDGFGDVVPGSGEYRYRHYPATIR
jgi:hypothetical protein